MVDINKLKQQAKEAAEKGLVKDQSKEDAGGDFKYEPPAAGPCYGRLVSYIEVGNHAKKVDKFNKGAQPTAIVQFELLGKKHAKEIEVDGVKKIIYPVVTERVVISGSKKSWFYKMMHSLDYGRGNTHMAFMLGEAFKITVLHNKQDVDGKEVIYANIRDDSGWKISAPVMEKTDEEGNIEVLKVKVPEPTVPLRLFLWDAPSTEMWESIFIDGEYTREIDGKEQTFSRNVYQQQITEAENFGGSPVETFLASTSGSLPKTKSTDSDGEADLDDDLDEGPEDTGEGENGQSGAADGEDDPLAGLDLDD